MSAAAKKPDAFGATLEALRTIYEEEIKRLVEVYRPRVLTGEFSGTGDTAPRYFELEDDLEEHHPWLRTVKSAMAIIGVSPWTVSGHPENCVELSEDRIVRASAAECMAHDIMWAAVARRWVKPPAKGKHQNDAEEPYALRVA